MVLLDIIDVDSQQDCWISCKRNLSCSSWLYDDFDKICYLTFMDADLMNELMIELMDQPMDQPMDQQMDQQMDQPMDEPILKLNLGSREFCNCNKSIIFHQGILSETGVWLAPDNTANSFIVMDLSCIKEITGVYLENLVSEERGTKTFQMYFYKEEEESGNMNQIETNITSLEPYDAQGSNSHVFVEFNSTIKTKFLVFQIISFYGKGGGLSFFEEYEALNPGNINEY